MFIRVKSSKNSPKKSVQIVEPCRNQEGKVRQRIVRHMGTALDEREIENLKNFAEYVKAGLEEEKTPGLFKSQQLADMAIEARREAEKKKEESLPVNLKNISEESKISIGVPEALGKVYERLGFDKLIGSRKKAAGRHLRDVVMARIANPKSKLRTATDLSKDFGIDVSVDSIYRIMDCIGEEVVDKARLLSCQAAQKLLGGEVSLLFYDCTTLYFESFQEDEFRRNGYSKDMKFNQPQVVLGLLTTMEGLPVGYEASASS